MERARSDQAWPQGDGEMARLIRAHDWAATPLGPVEGWPGSLRTALDMVLAMPGPATILWGPAHVQLYNDAYVPIAQDRHPALLGRPVAEGWPDAHDAVVAPLLDAARAGRATRLVEFAVALRGPDGRTQERVFDTDWSPIRDESGAVAGALQTLTEATGRLRAEAALRESDERNAFLVRFSDAVRGLSDPALVAKEACRILTGQLGTERTLWAVIDRETREYVSDWVFSADGTAAEPSRWPFDEREPFAAEHLAGRPVIYDDVALDPRIPDPVKAAMTERGLLAGIAVPVLVGGELVAVLNTSQSIAPRRWKADEVAFVEALAQRAWAEIERARSEAALRASEEERRSLIAGMNEGFCILEVILDDAGNGIDYRFLETNPAFVRQGGFDPAGRLMSEIAPIEPIWPAAYGRVATSGVPERIVDAAASFGRMYDVYAFRIGDAADRRIAVFFSDITERKRAEEALRASEEKYRTLFENMTEGYGIGELARDAAGRAVDWRFIEVNPALERHTGLDPASFVGRWFEELFPGTDRSYWLDIYQSVVDTQTPRPFEDYWPPIDRWLGGVASPAGGERFYIHHRDVTDRKRDELALRESEARQAFLLELSDTLRPLTDAGEVERQATRLLGEHLKADRCFLSPVYEDGLGMCVRGEYLRSGASSVLGDYTFAQFGDFVGPELHAGRILAVEDVAALTGLSAAERASYAAVEIGAYLLIPVTRDGRLAAFLTINHRTPRGWSEADKAVARQTADRLWAARERARVETALRESEARLTAAFESVPLGVAVIDEGGAAVISNSEYRRFLPSGVIPSRDPARLARWKAWDANGRLLEPHDFPGARALRGESVVPGQEMLYTDDDGREIWTQVATAPTRDQAGRVTGAVTVISDIDVAKRSLEALRESEERFRAIAEAVEDVFYMTDLERGALLYLSPSYERVWGRPAADLMADLSTFPQTIHPDDRPMVEMDMAAQSRGEPVVTEYRIVRPDGEVRWIYDRSFPVGDQGTRRSAGIAADITLRREIEAAAQESGERLRQFGEASSAVIWIRNADTLQWEYLSPAFETIYGMPCEEALSGDNMATWVDLIEPEDRDHAVAEIERVRRGERVSFEYRIRRPFDGQVRWLRNTDFPIPDETGRVERFGGVGEDVTAMKAAEAAVAESEARLRTLMEGIPQLVWRSCEEGLWTWASPQWLSFTGQTQEGSRGWGWLDAVHPDDRETTMRVWEEAKPHGLLDTEYRVRRAFDGAYLWHHTRSIPVHDADGRIAEWLGTTTDVQQLKELQERQGVLVAELQHRVRNILTVIRSVFGRTAETGGELDEVADHFRGRLDALARTQVIVTSGAEQRVDLENLIRDELLSVGVSDGPDVRIEGPEVRLPHKQAESIGLAVHELTTNAIKYGALKTSDAKLVINWSVDPCYSGEQRLEFTWTEQGVPAVPVAPSREGFGRELIEEALPYRLGAETELEFRPGGVRCRISLPLSDRDAAAEHADEVI